MAIIGRMFITECHSEIELLDSFREKLSYKIDDY